MEDRLFYNWNRSAIIYIAQMIIKYSDRSCKKCKKYPCFKGIDKCKSDFAKYGCLDFVS